MKLDLFSFKSFKPFSHISYEEFKQAKTFILGHFTSSKFLSKILEDGLIPPSITGNFSNDDMIAKGDEDYIYLAAHYDNVFSRNAIEKYGGNEILILLEVDKSTLELDDLHQKYSRDNINLADQIKLHEVLTQDIFAQCRTKKHIKPSQIIKVLEVPTNKIITI